MMVNKKEDILRLDSYKWFRQTGSYVPTEPTNVLEVLLTIRFVKGAISPQ